MNISQTNPALLSAEIILPGQAPLLFRPVAPGDAAILGRYFCSLSPDTIRRYGPHPFDQATADRLCAEIDHNQFLRMIAVLQGEVAAYFILQPMIPAAEIERYARAGIVLDPDKGCLIAPSVADALQNQGLGTPLMGRMFDLARLLGFEKMVLMGGVYVTNERAVHYYRKLGFRDIGITFENPPDSGRISYDMHIDL